MTSASSTNNGSEFALGPTNFNSGINQFLDARTGSRVTSVLRTDFDLSNNNTTDPGLSQGDFTGAVASCPAYGCGFFVNDPNTRFASRFRGYLNVTPAMVGQPVHFGFYADDAVSFTLFDRNQTPHSIVTRPPELGSPAWRTTNSVTFGSPGLYPVEVLYAELVEHAALEMSILAGSFTDFEYQPGVPGSVSLSASNFTLARPAQFLLTEDGTPPANPDQCTQCLRQNANVPGNGGCGSGNYCNAAAVCAPCTSALFCGPSCVACGGALPVCATVGGVTGCVQCRQDGDCRAGQKCNLETSQCQECTENAHCPRGQRCSAGGRCEACSSTTSCAGNSCNCCLGAGTGLRCAAVQPGTAPTCVECVSDSDCPSPRKCDTVNGRCVLEIAPCNTSDRCGPGCTRCPAERPLCMDGQVCVECRSDLDCGNGKFCQSGECTACATDRRCGTRCESCGGDTPYCSSAGGTAAGARCVRCRGDGDCEAGAACDPTSGECSTGCSQSCGPGTVCHGDRCVECFANSHCSCGGVCDVARGQCISGCDSSLDCGAGEYCAASTGVCTRGRRKPDTEPKGGGLCCALVTGPAPFLMAALAAVVLASRRKRGPAR